MRSNRKLIRKHIKWIKWCAVREALCLPVPICTPMWMNYEILRQGKALRERITRKTSVLGVLS